MKILVTGGAGFIGSHFIKLALKKPGVKEVINLDKLTYAGNLKTLEPVASDPRYRFVHGDIADPTKVDEVMQRGVDVIINCAAETHVDRSILDAADFIKTDMEGVFTLLESCRRYGIKRFIQVSTDEVYGSIREGHATELFPLMPSNPYSASKTGGDRLAYSYHVTYNLPVIITRASNNYGPYQYPEKIIPLFITNLLKNKKCPLYGDGLQSRDWIHVEDHCDALWFLLEHGRPGETYNVAGSHEMTNRVLTDMLVDMLDVPLELIEKVADRPGHDRRYAMDASKLKTLGWQPRHAFQEGLRRTVEWYRDNEAWWGPIKSGEFKDYYDRQYRERFEGNAG